MLIFNIKTVHATVEILVNALSSNTLLARYRFSLTVSWAQLMKGGPNPCLFAAISLPNSKTA